MSVKKSGQRGWMTHKQAVNKSVNAHRRDAFKQGRAGRISAEEAQDRIEAAESRRPRRWF